ncbi:MAG: DUF1848 domain-containing protein [Thermoflexales bacterium]|nr:DUF1848 domain-containing protein [Thermoflexales bacterium]
MKVISASRRTDLPAFYTTWFMNRIRAGFCYWINPFSNQVYRVSLAPEDCLAIVFWTRNPAPLLPHLAELDEKGYQYYFLYTLLAYPRPLEAHTPGLEAAIRTFQTLSERVMPERVFWRYDPIILSSLTPVSFHLERFAYVAQRLAGYTRRCIYSFMDVYGKVQRNLARLSAQDGIEFHTPSVQERHALLREMVRIGQASDVNLYACCEEDYTQVEGIRKSHCVDLDVLRQVTSNPTLELEPRPTRPGCGCVESVDIGSYDTCCFGCAYCYATNSPEVAARRHAAHDPDDTILCRPPGLKGVDLGAVVQRA